MKIKKKLRDLLPCEYEVWIDKKCPPQRCTTCVFANVVCSTLDDSCWFYHQEQYSDKFLNQEIEVDLLTPEEKEYLEGILEPIKNKVRSITKKQSENSTIAYIHISIDNSDLDCSFDSITLNYSKADTAYANMESNREYKLEELGLFEEEK